MMKSCFAVVTAFLIAAVSLSAWGVEVTAKNQGATYLPCSKTFQLQVQEGSAESARWGSTGSRWSSPQVIAVEVDVIFPSDVPSAVGLFWQLQEKPNFYSSILVTPDGYWSRLLGEGYVAGSLLVSTPAGHDGPFDWQETGYVHTQGEKSLRLRFVFQRDPGSSPNAPTSEVVVFLNEQKIRTVGTGLTLRRPMQVGFVVFKGAEPNAVTVRFDNLSIVVLE